VPATTLYACKMSKGNTLRLVAGTRHGHYTDTRAQIINYKFIEYQS
jgi:hypothetical protein